MPFLDLHGARVQVPSDWEDLTVFRFAAPSPPLGLLAGKPARRAQANAVITRMPRVAGDPPRAMLDGVGAERAAKHPSYSVVATGEVDYFGQPAAWVDSTLVDADSGLSVYQRSVALPVDAEGFVLIVLTGTKADVAMMADRMGL